MIGNRDLELRRRWELEMGHPYRDGMMAVSVTWITQRKMWRSRKRYRLRYGFFRLLTVTLKCVIEIMCEGLLKDKR